MKNDYAKRLRQAYLNGLDEGFMTANMLFLLAFKNTADDYVAEEKQATFAREIEREMNRIFEERAHNRPEELSELIVGHVSLIRREYGMEGLEG